MGREREGSFPMKQMEMEIALAPMGLGRKRFEIPRSWQEGCPEIIQFLEREEKRRRVGITREDIFILAWDLITKRASLVNPYNWQIEGEGVSLGHFEVPQALIGGLVIISPPNKIDEISESLRNCEPLLYRFPGASVLVFERKNEGTTFDLNRRKDVLTDLGLVGNDILVRPRNLTGFLVWRSTTPTRPKRRRPVNLLAGPSWRRAWVAGLLEKGKADCEEAGYVFLGNTVMRNQLQSSTYPSRDVRAASFGWGVTLEAHCGCTREVNPRGIWGKPVPGCSEPNCGGPLWGTVNGERMERRQKILADFLRSHRMKDVREVVSLWETGMMHLRPGPYSEKDIGEIKVDRRCSCVYVVLQVTTVDPGTISSDRPAEFGTAIVAVLFDPCQRHKREREMTRCQ